MTTLSNATMTEPKFRTAAGTDHSPSSATGAILVTGAGGEMGHALLEVAGPWTFLGWRCFLRKNHGN